MVAMGASALCIAGCALTPQQPPGAPLSVAPGQLHGPPVETEIRPAPADSEPHTFAAGAALSDLQRYAQQHNPGLQAAFYRWQAAVEQIPQATALPDPQLDVGIVLDQVDQSSERMGERYSISQPFPWFGKLALRGAIAGEAAKAEASRLESFRLRLHSRVTQAWFEYAWLQQAITTTEQSRDLLQSMDSVAKSRYRTGTGTQADLNRAQVELGRLEEQVRSYEDMRGVAAAELNAVLGRATLAPLPVPLAPSVQTAPALPDRSESAWLQLARGNNPDLIAAKHQLARDEQATELARKQYFPDIHLGLEYAREGSARMAGMDGGGSDMLVGMVSLSLPLQWGKYRAGIRESEARAYAASRDARAVELDLESTLRRALFEHRDSARKLALYASTLVPTARQAVANTEAAYRSGTASFSDLLDTQRTLLELELARERAAADHAISGSVVRALVGPSAAGDEHQSGTLPAAGSKLQVPEATSP